VYVNVNDRLAFNRHPEKIAMPNCRQLINYLNSLYLTHGDRFVVTPVGHTFDLLGFCLSSPWVHFTGGTIASKHNPTGSHAGATYERPTGVYVTRCFPRSIYCEYNGVGKSIQV